MQIHLINTSPMKKMLDNLLPVTHLSVSCNQPCVQTLLLDGLPSFLVCNTFGSGLEQVRAKRI